MYQEKNDWSIIVKNEYQRRTSQKYFRTSMTPFFFFLDAIVLATYQVVFAGLVFNQFLSDFKSKHRCKGLVIS